MDLNKQQQAQFFDADNAIAKDLEEYGNEFSYNDIIQLCLNHDFSRLVGHFVATNFALDISDHDYARMDQETRDFVMEELQSEIDFAASRLRSVNAKSAHITTIFNHHDIEKRN